MPPGDPARSRITGKAREAIPEAREVCRERRQVIRKRAR
jgi:hypothetical protein